MNRLIAAFLALILAAPAVAQQKPLVTMGGQTRQLPSGTTLGVNASTTGAASLNVPQGTAPTSPNDGDCWTTSNGSYCRTNGTTYGPFGQSIGTAFTQSGAGAVARTVDSRLKETVSVADFASTLCTGSTTNDQVAIAAALARASAAGIRDVKMPAGVCGISAAISIPQNVNLVGQGGANYGVCTTTLKWVGTAGGTLINNAVASSVIVGTGLQNLCLDGNNSAAYGIYKRGVNNGRYANLYLSGFTSRAIFEDVPVTATFADQLSTWDNIYVSCTGSGVACWEIGNSSADFDVASNHYNKIILVPANSATGFICGNSDGNTYNGFYALNGGGTPGYSFIAKRGTTNDITSCREHIFIGEAVFLTGFKAEGGTHPSFGNIIQSYKLGDGEPNPTIEGGATLFYTTSYGDAKPNSVTATTSISLPGSFTANTNGIATGSMGITVSSSKNWLGGDTTIGAGSALLGNLYFDSAFKFAGNGRGAQVALGGSSFPFSVAISSTNNASGAGAAATLNNALLIDPSANVFVSTGALSTGGFSPVGGSTSKNWLGGETTIPYQSHIYGNSYFNSGFKFAANGTAAFMTLGESATIPISFYTSTTNNAGGAGAAATFATWLTSDLNDNVIVGGGGLKLVPKTVSGLPTCNSGNKGLRYDVTDASAPTWNGTLAGGGAVTVGALCNGTNWVAF